MLELQQIGALGRYVEPKRQITLGADLPSVVFELLGCHQSAIKCRLPLQRRGRPVGLSTAGARREEMEGRHGICIMHGTGIILSGRLAPEILA